MSLKEGKPTVPGLYKQPVGEWYRVSVRRPWVDNGQPTEHSFVDPLAMFYWLGSILREASDSVIMDPQDSLAHGLKCCFTVEVLHE